MDGVPKRLIVLVVLVVVLIGLAYDVYGSYTAAKSLDINTRVDRVGVKGFKPPFSILPSEVVITLEVTVVNPTPFTIKVDNLVYNVYVEGRFLGNGSKSDIFIPPNGREVVYVDLSSRIRDVLNILVGLVLRGDTSIEYEVRGRAVVPVRLFQAIPLLKVEVPFQVSGSIDIEIRPKPP